MRLIAWKPWTLSLLALIIAGSGVLLIHKDATKNPVSEDLSAVLTAGKAFIEKGAYEEAVAYFRARLSRVDAWAPETTRIYHILGYLLLYADRIEEAIQNTWAAHAGLSTGVFR
jgi:hypothetical protein